MDLLTRLRDPRERDAVDILLVSADSEHDQLVRAVLSEIPCGADRALRGYRLHAALSTAEAVAALGEGAFDVVLLDLALPEATAAVSALLAVPAPVPIVALADTRDEEFGLEIIRHGAQDYLASWQLNASLLERSLVYAIERQRLLRDLTLRTREVAAAEERLGRLIAGSADAIVITDLAGIVRFANPAAESLFHRSRRELTGRPLGCAVDVPVVELTIPGPGGTFAVAESRATDLEWQGAPARLVVLRDITAHKETLRQLEETRLRQVTVRDQLLSNVSHELRTPLTAVQQWATLLRDGVLGPLDVEQQRAIGAVVRNCGHLEKLIDDLLEATRSETGRLRVEPLRTSLAAVAEEATAAVRAAMRDDVVNLDVDLPSDLPPVLADPARLRQILVNLLGNAVKFTPVGGNVHLTAARDSAGPYDVRVSVSDSGCGIAPEEHDRIFEHFYQTGSDAEMKRRGLGLGLYLCRQFVGAHGGRIWVESGVGRGSTFHFTIPAFSCRALLAGLPPPTGRGGPCLVGVLARTADGQRLRDFEARYLDSIRRTIGDCLMPDRDLLLPRFAVDEQGECSFVVAGADEAGAGVLVARLRDQLARSVENGGGRLAVSFTVAPLSVPATSAADAEQWLNAIEAVLEPAVLAMLAAAGMDGLACD
jgi:signal transduction histidine kinase